jgi:hypothetical protein
MFIPITSFQNIMENKSIFSEGMNYLVQELVENNRILE